MFTYTRLALKSRCNNGNNDNIRVGMISDAGDGAETSLN